MSKRSFGLNSGCRPRRSILSVVVELTALGLNFGKVFGSTKLDCILECVFVQLIGARWWRLVQANW